MRGSEERGKRREQKKKVRKVRIRGREERRR